MGISFPLLKTFSSTELVQPDAYPEYDDHEAVVFIRDAETGLRGFIAIHNTNRGPAVGGTRFWQYASEAEALRDALRLSRAMSYKCALADVPYGGGKAVLLAPKDFRKSDAYLTAYAKRLDSFGCGFYTGEDVGLDEDDIRILSGRTNCIIGRPDIGDLPAKWAAMSVFVAMKAALREVFGSATPARRTVAIKGLGNVGMDLAKLVAEAGGTVIAADILPERADAAKKNIPGIEIVPSDKILNVEADIFAPCALGGDISDRYAQHARIKIVCGAANNQLASDHAATHLHEKGILYIPDYVANSGGLINVVDELNRKGYNRDRVRKKIAGVEHTVQELIAASKRENVSTETVAGEIARRRIAI